MLRQPELGMRVREPDSRHIGVIRSYGAGFVKVQWEDTNMYSIFLDWSELEEVRRRWDKELQCFVDAPDHPGDPV